MGEVSGVRAGVSQESAWANAQTVLWLCPLAAGREGQQIQGRKGLAGAGKEGQEMQVGRGRPVFEKERGRTEVRLESNGGSLS